jgi:enamine deaminase RidA (YjgF/YER057c/UK114 family)
MKKRFNNLPKSQPYWKLPKSFGPDFQYATTVKTGNLLFVSGHGPKLVGFDDFNTENLPISKNKEWITGRLGEGITIEQAKTASEAVVANMISTINEDIKDLNKINKFVRLLVFINASENFTDHYIVANAAAEFLINYFGEKGKCAMTVAGMDSVFSNIPVEIELILELKY